ncbi:unnamed protein product [Penicillium roqueforti FM164]|uniref:Genomic scaffold, ProqFM164S01 n=1 Tax=Penicillium roqueforti (strain FM164) TaxID=1365484 RepID=W6Q0R8_PENRF|nr:unnamed protein product [Penicillium roqueforti FM164]
MNIGGHWRSSMDYSTAPGLEGYSIDPMTWKTWKTM